MMKAQKASILHEDRLGEGADEAGQVILHHGDPSYPACGVDDPRELPAPEALFLRIIAYLVFAEKVCIPARYILSSADTFAAVKMAEPLLREGLVCPERRAEASSCEELAGTLGLPEAAMHRGEWLDTIAKSVRVFRSIELADYYRSVLLHDLGPDGGLRKAMDEELLRVSLDDISRAHEAYAYVLDGTPEAYWRTVAEYAPLAESFARQWAMARYYITPTVFDSLNTREVPRSAANLLVRGQVIDEEMRPLDVPAPAESLFSQMSMQLPAYDVRSRARDFCEAVLTIRGDVPKAREVFADVQRRAELSPLSNELAQLMQRELNRQRGVKRASGMTVTVAASLGGAAIGLIAGQEPAIGVAAGLGSGIAGHGAQKMFEERRERKRKPWVVAIDRMTRDLPAQA